MASCRESKRPRNHVEHARRGPAPIRCCRGCDPNSMGCPPSNGREATRTLWRPFQAHLGRAQVLARAPRWAPLPGSARKLEPAPVRRRLQDDGLPRRWGSRESGWGRRGQDGCGCRGQIRLRRMPRRRRPRPWPRSGERWRCASGRGRERRRLQPGPAREWSAGARARATANRAARRSRPGQARRRRRGRAGRRWCSASVPRARFRRCWESEGPGYGSWAA